MEIKRVGSQSSVKGSADWFTGTVRIDPLFEAAEPARVRGANVTFEPGARTAWHTHPLGQTLIVTSGLGWAQREGGPIEEIRPGDVVWFSPNEKHWHGATPTTAMTHIAIQEALNGEVVEWMEKVTDEEYLSGKQESRKLTVRIRFALVFLQFPYPNAFFDSWLLILDMRTGAGGGERQNAEGLRLFPHETDGTRIPPRVHARADAETNARARRVRREIHDRLPERISGELVQAREAFA